MRTSSPIEAVASAVHHAQLVALPDLPHQVPDQVTMAAWPVAQRVAAMQSNDYPVIHTTRRPELWECEVEAMFVQMWPSTALGFGGIGGHAMTRAYTVVVRGPDGARAVYWAGRFAYLVPATVGEAQRRAFAEDVRERQLVSQKEAAERYGAQF